MSIDVEPLLAEISSDSPCGPDLEYDPGFSELEQVARGKPEQRIGDNVVPAEEPDWGDVRRRAEELFSRTKDVRVAILYTRALTRTEHFDGLDAGLRLIGDLLARYWDQIHPRLDPDENNDPTMRLNALAALTDPDTLLRDLRSAYLVRPGSYGRVSVRDILVVAGRLPATDPVPSQAELEGIIRAAGAQNAVSAGAARGCLQGVSALQTLLTEKVGSQRAPDLKPMGDILAAVAQFCDTVLGVATSQTSEEVPGGGGVPAVAIGDIRSREDAKRVLDQVCQFIERTEPTNPAPLFIRRAQHLMTKTFVEIIQDLAPDSLGQIQKMTGLDRQETG